MPDLRPTWEHLLRKARARVRSRGVVEFAAVARERAAQELHSEGRLIFYERGVAPGDPPPVPEGFVIRPATVDDAGRYARAIGTDSPETFVARLSDDTRCWLMLQGERLLHASWTTTGASWVRELRRYFRPAPGELYVYESFTRREARGRGAYPLVLHAIVSDAAAAGLSRAWVGVEDENSASIRAITKAGFAPACEISWRRRLGRLRVDPPGGAQGEECAARLRHHPA